MKEKETPFKSIANQHGMALISALLLLLVVSLMAVGVSMDTSMDVRIAGYQRFKARSFGFAESGIMAATDILEDNIHNAGWNGALPLAYPNLSGLYNGNVNILNDGNFYMNENSGANPATFLSMTDDIQADIVTQRIVAKLAKGGAIQMAAGYAGLGKGTGGGGAHIVYNLLATGRDADQSRTDLALHFRHVTK